MLVKARTRLMEGWVVSGELGKQITDLTAEVTEIYNEQIKAAERESCHASTETYLFVLPVLGVSPRFLAEGSGSRIGRD